MLIEISCIIPKPIKTLQSLFIVCRFIGSRNEDGKSNSQIFCKRLDLVNE